MSQTSSTISRVPASTIAEEAPAVLSPWREFAQAFLHNKGATLGLIFMVCMVLLAIFALGFVNVLVHARDAYAAMPGSLICSIILALLTVAAVWTGFSRPQEGVAA